MDGRVKIMASVCTGAAVLARAGLLDGLAAATNHSMFSWVATHGPEVLWDSISKWVDAGEYVTSAGVSAGTDIGFYLVSRLAGRAVAENAVTAAEYDWHRDPQAPIFYPRPVITQRRRTGASFALAASALPRIVGIRVAVAEIMHASWRCWRMHFMHNALAHASKSWRRVVSTFTTIACVAAPGLDHDRRPWSHHPISMKSKTWMGPNDVDGGHFSISIQISIRNPCYNVIVECRKGNCMTFRGYHDP